MVLWAVLSFSREDGVYGAAATDSKASAPVPAKSVQHGQARNVAQAIKRAPRICRSWVGDGRRAMQKMPAQCAGNTSHAAASRAAASQISATSILMARQQSMVNFYMLGAASSQVAEIHRTNSKRPPWRASSRKIAARQVFKSFCLPQTLFDKRRRLRLILSNIYAPASNVVCVVSSPLARLTAGFAPVFRTYFLRAR